MRSDEILKFLADWVSRTSAIMLGVFLALVLFSVAVRVWVSYELQSFSDRVQKVSKK